jgi:CheY-like chemotaxis protein
MAGKRVLVIDDNAVNRRLVQVLLRSRGYEGV